MKVLILAAGSRGDVAPYTGVGARLREAGYEVALATHGTYEPLVRASGLEFRSLPADPNGGGSDSGRGGRGGEGSEDGGGGAANGRDTEGGSKSLLRKASAFIQELGRGIADAVAQGADLLLLSTTTAPLGWHAAEASGIPSLGVYLQPVAPTGCFPPVVGGTRSLGRWGNRAAGRVSLRVVDRLHAAAARDLRDRLGLPAVPPGAMRRRQEAAGWRILHGFSETLVPRPADWREGLEVVGNWWPHHPAGARLPAEVADFIGAGPPPVFIGFGSMAGGDGERLSGLAVQALRAAGLRGVLQAGAAGLSASSAAAHGDDVLTVGDVPHAPLFPRMAAVVHHSGAGTAAAGLRAGVPAVPVPVMADQPFWARRLTSLGAATAPIPFTELTADRLADALRSAVTDASYRAGAARAALAVDAEDGAGRVAAAVKAAVGG
ncbi:glycosyltransferase [Streptomyces sp. NPDC050617]|uniref:glycosyltransferase n=1 Tax=Streptomyces sp. NPDC050617 TaxID=3154628 RepID=UPI00341AF808